MRASHIFLGPLAVFLALVAAKPLINNPLHPIDKRAPQGATATTGPGRPPPTEEGPTGPTVTPPARKLHPLL